MTSEAILSIFNTLWYGVYATALCILLQRRFGWLATILSFVGVYAVFLTYGLFFEFSVDNAERAASALRLLLMMFMYFVPAIFLFREKWYKSLFTGGVCFAMQLVADLLSATLLIPHEQLRSGSMADLPPNLVIVLELLTTALILFLTALFVILMRNRTFRLAPTEWILFCIFPVSQIVLLGGWQFVSMSELNTNRVLVMSIGMGLSVAADGFLFFAVRGMAQRRSLTMQKELLEQQVELQKKHYAALTDQYEDMRRMRHDIANHLETMKALLECGEYAEASSYTENAAGWFRYRSRVGTCENPIVDAFLMAKLEELKQQGCTPEIRIAVPRELPIANVDIIAAFGNLLDNVAEACAESGEGQFTLTAAVNHGFLTIRTDNPVGEKKQPHSRRIRELPRGIGHQILSDLAEKYDGSFRAGEENGVYTATLSLNTEVHHAADRNL